MKAKVVQECYKGYEWSQDFSGYEMRIDEKKLKEIIKHYNHDSAIIITLLSKEYLNLGKLWLSHINKIKTKQLVVIATDIETSVYLDSVKTPNCLVETTVISENKNSYKSRTGFSSKGLAITNLKYPIVKLILKLGYDTLLIDIDAVLLKPIPNKYFADIDIAFQRVVYFPDPIAKVWSFTACSGFVFFRSSKSVINLVDNAIKSQKKTYDDQIALNVSLWNNNIKWLKVESVSDNLELEERKRYFTVNSTKTIYGNGVKTGIRIKALPSNMFWRNEIVSLEISKVILLHPNSEKTEVEKLKKLKLLLNKKHYLKK
jgi:hypothetical protein